MGTTRENAGHGTDAPVAGSYHARADRFRAEAEAARIRRDRLATSRLAVFLAAAGAVFLAFTRDGGSIAWWIASLALVGVFARLVRLQGRARAARSRASDLARLNGEAEARVSRSWDDLPPAEHPDGSAPPVARDLGMFGRGSLFQLLGTARTTEGRRILARWLLDPAPAAEIASRQAAVRELAPALDLRQEIEREGLRAEAIGPAVRGFVSWAESPDLLPERSALVLLAWVLPATLVLLGAGHAAGLLPPLWIGVIPASAVVWVASARRVASGLAGLDVRAEALSGYVALFSLIEGAGFRSQRLGADADTLRGSDGVASDRIRRLRQIASMAEVRYSPMLYIPLQLFFLWDIHVLRAMDRWRRRSGVRVRNWLAATGDVEAIAALAGLAFDNPDWVYPRIEPSADRWEADALAHPLLPAGTRVANDVRLGPPGSFLLVTGSNMSGKSTLLRAIGVNVTLAHAGAPVCAERFVIPQTRLGTSFVIEDSLGSGVSYFMAELQRLRTIVEEAGEAGAQDDWRYLFLLDEILKGTNSGERQIAVRRILGRLLEAGACGAISTHDLTLADVPDLRERSVRVHFREHYERGDGAPRMAFDYLLRDGIATTSNALALLEMMGIDGGPAGDGAGGLAEDAEGERHGR